MFSESLKWQACWFPYELARNKLIQLQIHFLSSRCSKPSSFGLQKGKAPAALGMVKGTWLPRCLPSVKWVSFEMNIVVKKCGDGEVGT